MPQNDTTALVEFKISIEWAALQRDATYHVIARNLSDAEEIARRLFLKEHDRPFIEIRLVREASQ